MMHLDHPGSGESLLHAIQQWWRRAWYLLKALSFDVFHATNGATTVWHTQDIHSPLTVSASGRQICNCVPTVYLQIIQRPFAAHSCRF